MKKSISLVMVLAMCLSLCVPTLAADTSHSMVPESQIQAEIHSEEDRIFGEVYDQLKAQNALKYLSTFEEILRPQIEMSVRAEYNIATNSITTNSLNLYYWPNGGVTTCISSPGNLSVATTLMNYDDTYNYILSTGGSFTLRDVIQAILGFIPKFGNVFSGIFSMPSTTSLEVSAVLDSSMVMTPSAETFSIASAISLPMVSSPEDTVPTRAMSLVPSTFLACLLISATAASTALAMNARVRVEKMEGVKLFVKLCEKMEAVK